VIRTAIHQLKFRRARFLTFFLAQILAEALARRPLEADLVLPVPLSVSRHRERGFNQSELIAQELAKLGCLPAPGAGLLARPLEGRPQVGLPAAERRRNLRGAFGCPRPDQVAGRRCLLIDDVMTTGATLSACALPLLAAGAERVMALVVAREA
jgi:ComF family protein